jgi:hypothetical protein
MMSMSYTKTTGVIIKLVSRLVLSKESGICHGQILNIVVE